MALLGFDASTTTLQQVQRHAADYPEHILGSIRELDLERTTHIPQGVNSRLQLGEAYLTWDELHKLTQWKL